MTRPTDNELLQLANVPTDTAALYLGISNQSMRLLLQSGNCPFGTAVKAKRWVYVIPPERLINWKHGN